MEPLNPKLRVALKEVHSGLTDEDIDRSEELLAQRMLCNPEEDADRIQQLDRQRIELIQRKMPRYAEVARAVNAQVRGASKDPTQKVSVKLKKPEK